MLATTPPLAVHAILGAASPGAITDPMGVLTVLLVVLAAVFGLGQTRIGQAVYRVVPMLVFCYFVPTLLTTLGVLPEESALYAWIRGYLLPASLLLLILALDVPGILRLGWKPGVMFLTGTLGVVLGGPLALYVGEHVLSGSWQLPPDAWRGFAALSGSWIGGGANFLAIGDAVGTPTALLTLMVIPDVLIANIWTGVLLYFAGRQGMADRWFKADTTTLRAVEAHMAATQAQTAHVPTLAELMIIVALAFGCSYASHVAAQELGVVATAHLRGVATQAGIVEIPGAADAAPVSVANAEPGRIGPAIAHRLQDHPEALAGLSRASRVGLALARFVHEALGVGTLKYLLITTIGVALSFSVARRLEGAGASKLGSVMLYLLVATIGAQANFAEIVEAPGLVVVAALWLCVHAGLLVFVAWLIRAPIFFLAVGSQANIGGAASAPIVAAAYHPALAPVGVLLAIGGYVLGTYGGLVCAALLRWVAGI